MLCLASKYAEALAGASYVVKEASAIGDLALEADATRANGEILWRLGRTAEAIDKLYRAVDLAKRARASLVEGGALLDLVGVLYEVGRYAEALQVAPLADSSLRALHDDALLAQLLSTRMGIHATLGEDAEAKRLGQEALAVFVRAYDPNSPVVGQALQNLATLETDPVAALALYDRALALYEKGIPEPRLEIATVLANRGQTFADLERFDDARRDLENALSILRDLLGPTHRDTVMTLWQSAEVEARGGNHTEALRRFREGFADARASIPDDHLERAEPLRLFAVSLAATGETRIARESLERALAIWKANAVETEEVAKAREQLAALARR